MKVMSSHESWLAMGKPLSIVKWAQRGEYDEGVVLGRRTLKSALKLMDRHTCAIISPTSGDYSKEENERRNDQLKSWLIYRYEATVLEGYWKNQTTGKLEIETAFFVSNSKVKGHDGGDIFDDMADVARFYKQFAFIGTEPPIDLGTKKCFFHLFETSYKRDAASRVIWSNRTSKLIKLDKAKKKIGQYLETYVDGFSRLKNKGFVMDFPEKIEKVGESASTVRTIKLHAYRCHIGSFMENISRGSSARDLESQLRAYNPKRKMAKST